MSLSHLKMFQENVLSWEHWQVFFNARSWKRRKNIANFWGFFEWWKNPEVVLNNLVSPTFVPNFVILPWKMSPGMPKEASSLNGLSCKNLMRQNLHNQTLPGFGGNKYPCKISKWSAKNYGRESVHSDFQWVKLENAKKNCSNFCWRFW